jgi:effector-binding domain-containing protein
MIAIERNKSIKFDNLLSIRKKMTQQEINIVLTKIGNLLEEKGIKKNGPIISATFSVEMVEGQPLLDMEILVPLDKKVELPEGYKFKELFNLNHAVYARHIGNPTTIESTYKELAAYIKENNLQPITVGYNVNIKDIKPEEGFDEMITDIYIGVNPSIL